ncbi:LysR family transcriptional regulator [Corynebacterium accolens]|uniref:LysR family transcriptional regulator n=1 Tax=Corynebacterium accolens TaxID=38284 RepID=UPI002542FCD6|nr:LysR family transcriptional regulator [Corynebacterium accolens]WKS61935.1 LysR family transcriptional regulator [Corynebacterium accolens]
MSEAWPNLQVLELFVAVVDEGSVGAGARKVGMAQPNASRAIAELETGMKTALLERSPRGSEPTALGLLLAVQARELLDAGQRFNDWSRSSRSNETLELRVGASMTIAETLLPVWLTELKRRLPPVRIEVQVLNSAQVLQEVQRGILQLGFVETPNVPMRLNARVVQEDELLVVVAPNHEWANRTSRIGLQELAETPLGCQGAWLRYPRGAARGVGWGRHCRADAGACQQRRGARCCCFRGGSCCPERTRPS